MNAFETMSSARRPRAPAALALAPALSLALLTWVLSGAAFSATSGENRAGSNAGKALVVTRDGQRLEGVGRIEEDRVVLVGDAEVSVGLSNLAEVVFGEGAPAVVQPNSGVGKGNGLLGFYYNNTNLSGTPLIRLDEAVHFDWGSKTAPMPGIDADYFSVRWMGSVEAPETEEYTFHFGADDGGRFWIAGFGPLSLWQRQEYAETNISLHLEAGKRYDVRLEYFDFFGNARAKFWWSTPSAPKAIVPKERLFAGSQLPDHQADIFTMPGLLGTYHDRPDLTGKTFSRIDDNIDFEWRTPMPEPVKDARREWMDGDARRRKAQAALEQLRQEHGLPGDRPSGRPADEDEEAGREFRNAQKRAWRQLEEARRRHLKAVEQSERAIKQLESVRKRDKDDKKAAEQMEEARRREAQYRAQFEEAQRAAEAFDRVLKQEADLKQTIASSLEATAGRLAKLKDVSREHRVHSVAPNIPANCFSARWSGQILARTGEMHTFCTMTDEGVRLWIDHKLAIDRWDQAGLEEQRCVVPLMAGWRYDLQMEIRNTDEYAVARLLWSTPSQRKAVVPQLSLAPARAAAAAEPQHDMTMALPAGVLLAGGVTIGARIVSADDSVLRLGGVLKDFPISRVNLARIYLRPISASFLGNFAGKNRPGLLLSKGDFLESQFVGLEGHTIQVRSVLFGLRAYTAGTQALAFIFRDLPPPPPRYLVKLIDGTAISAPRLRLESGAVAFPEVEGLKIPARQIAFIKRLEGATEIEK